MTFDEDQKTNQNFTISVGGVEYQESLVILVSLGTTKEYLGVEMSLEKIHKLSDKEVERYFNRYQNSRRAKRWQMVWLILPSRLQQK